MKGHRIVSLMTGVMAAVASVSGLAPLAAASDEIYNFGTNQCLQPVRGSTSQGAAIVQAPCDGGAAQQWTAVSVGNNIFHYVNSLSRLCLDARGGAVNHTPVQQWTCNNISNERWQPGDVPTDYIPPLISRVSGTDGYCLDIPGDQNTAGLAMQIYRCNGTGAQEWWTP
ncbi:MAG: RICIN domain-containing protein [Stellaceae bacterium]